MVEINLDDPSAASERIKVRKDGVILIDISLAQWALLLATFQHGLPCCHMRRLMKWVDTMDFGCGDPECCS